MRKDSSKQIDLNLLRCFTLLYQNKSIFLTAKQLELSSSMVSIHLRKLRFYFDDALFIRRKKLFLPTPFADSLYMKVSPGMALVASALERLNVSQAGQRLITIGSTPYITSQVVPLIMQLKSEDESLSDIGISHVELPSTIEAITLLLDSSKADIVLSYTPLNNIGLECRKLFTDSVEIICSKQHSCLTQKSITKAEYQNGTHAVLDTLSPAIHNIKQMVETQFPNRNIGFSSSYYLDLLAVVEISDMICLVPQMLFSKMRASFNIKSLSYNFSLGFRPPPLYVVFRKDRLLDPGMKWIFDILSKLEEG
ncbi:LysR substrate-binding domain-containing protein [Rahnella inusitata]|uniref:LysR substrate-binding domain-containing protein n=1 Tax=Rahnella inusitata TaxID=58169 RepID=UPI0039B0A7EA